MFRSRFASVITGLAMALGVIGFLATDMANAKVGGGSSMGSRGGRTFSAPPPTATAPKTTAPVERSITKPGTSSTNPASAAAATSRPSMFGGFRGLLLGGLIGAGLASIFGAGAFASVLGFVLQAALIGGLIYLAVNFFRNRSGQPAMATAAPNGMARLQPQAAAYRSNAAAIGSSSKALAIGPDDFNAFERLLSEIQLAYGRGDTRALGDRATPEMLSYFSADLAANAKKGVRNEVAEPKLLQGDLAESWRESNGEYASVAMRFSIYDRTVDAQSGALVAGNSEAPQESTEVWTFRRPLDGKPDQWELSAIQQAA